MASHYACGCATRAFTVPNLGEFHEIVKATERAMMGEYDIAALVKQLPQNPAPPEPKPPGPHGGDYVFILRMCAECRASRNAAKAADVANGIDT